VLKVDIQPTAGALSLFTLQSCTTSKDEGQAHEVLEFENFQSLGGSPLS